MFRILLRVLRTEVLLHGDIYPLEIAGTWRKEGQRRRKERKKERKKISIIKNRQRMFT
jgi:hypothetical protein